MKYIQLKEKLLSMFDKEKLQASLSEWGIFNESKEEIKCIGYAVNISPEVIQEASQQGVDLLLTHHDSWDFVFGLKEKCNSMLLDYNIVHAFFHAPLDDADFGTSASLAAALGVIKDKVDMPYMDIFNCGIIGDIPQTSFDEFSNKLSEVLEEPIRCFQNNSGQIKRVAVVTGGGNMTNEMQRAVVNDCDTYVTGEYVLYSQQFAKLKNMNLFVGSHTNTEMLGVESMGKKLCEGTDIRLIKISESNY